MAVYLSNMGATMVGSKFLCEVLRKHLLEPSFEMKDNDFVNISFVE